MSNKPQTPLNSPEMAKDTSPVMTPEVPATTTVPLSMKDTTGKSVPLPTVQPTTSDQNGSSDVALDPEFSLVAAASEFNIESTEKGIRAVHESGYAFEGTHAEFNRHIKESIKLFKDA